MLRPTISGGFAMALALAVLPTGVASAGAAALPPVPTHDITGSWYTTLRCPSGAGRFVYTIRQAPDGSLEGSSRGVSFGARGISGSIRSGRIRAGRLDLLEQVDAGYLLEFDGIVHGAPSRIRGTYRNSRNGLGCAFEMILNPGLPRANGNETADRRPRPR